MDQNEQPIGSKYVTVLGVVLFILCTLSKRLFNFQETPLSFGVSNKILKENKRHQEYLRRGKPWESKKIIQKS